ncbi:hypothetical protein B0H17DRAFT_1206879 [Mycena rosella]|uniref:Protein kinase domain-containing protein n=1 Tax=Mycena rosella TaxID=1033263 RepID=A0AAD7D3X5_MYCRO|nr:hypothetical protein B0H17DRAFT_1206879 [Mycena rosella]
MDFEGSFTKLDPGFYDEESGKWHKFEPIPLATCINWAIEIAEEIAHLHFKSVIWVDTHFCNVLVTDDLHVVLADFAFSIMDMSGLHFFTTMAPPVFACPTGYYGLPSTYVDIFGFGVMLFALLGY